MTVDLSTVPLVALSVESKQVISALLNPPKVIPSDNGLPRDWRGLAHLSNLSGEIMPLLLTHTNPSSYILTAWEEKDKNITIKNFQKVLEEIDRWDILDDTLHLFEKDAEKYLEQLQKSQTSAEAITNEIDEKILTVDDLYRFRDGLENQYYDAFLLYADDDINFATEMVEKLEDQYHLKLCLKDRDLIGGVTFEHEAVMTLISERCNRLIVIVSSNLLKSPVNKFFLNYAQALGIDKRVRKVIPCIYERCQLPPQLNYMFILDYNRVGLYDFWGKLRDSIQTPSKAMNSINNVTPEKQHVSHPEKENRFNNVKVNDEIEVNVENTKHLESSTVKNIQERNNEKKLNPEENLKIPQLNNLHSSKDGNKKYNFLKWTKKWIRKPENSKKEYVPITESVSLPSLEGLETLSISTNSVEKKKDRKFINKYVRKVQLKKVDVKS